MLALTFFLPPLRYFKIRNAVQLFVSATVWKDMSDASSKEEFNYHLRKTLDDLCDSLDANLKAWTSLL